MIASDSSLSAMHARRTPPRHGTPSASISVKFGSRWAVNMQFLNSSFTTKITAKSVPFEKRQLRK